MLVGVGDASFISLAAPFIDDNAPLARKTAWLSIFYMCIPTGIAVGYVYDLMFGGITIMCEIFGTLAGGFVLDKMESTISNAFKDLTPADLAMLLNSPLRSWNCV